VSTITVDVTNRAETLPTQVAQEKVGNNETGLPFSGQGANQVFTPHLYRRLLHPLSQLLKELPLDNAAGENLLYDFLLQVLKILQGDQMTYSTINEIMYPYCWGELLALITNAIRIL
jgi:hypothetical protein